MYTSKIKRFQRRGSGMLIREKGFWKRDDEEEDTDDDEEADDEEEESDDEEEESDNDDDNEDEDESDDDDNDGDKDATATSDISPPTSISSTLSVSPTPGSIEANIISLPTSISSTLSVSTASESTVANIISLPTSISSTLSTASGSTVANISPASDITMPSKTEQNGVQDPSGSGAGKVQTSMIVVIVIAVVAFVLVIVALFVRRKVLKKRAEKLVLPQTRVEDAPAGTYNRLNDEASPFRRIIPRGGPGRRTVYESRIWGTNSSVESGSEVASPGFFAVRKLQDRLRRGLGMNVQQKQLDINADPFQNINHAGVPQLPPMPGTMYRAGYEPNFAAPEPVFIQRTTETDSSVKETQPANEAISRQEMERQVSGGTLRQLQDGFLGEKRYSNAVTERTEPPRWRTPMSWVKDQRERLALNRSSIGSKATTDKF